ncbi:hypothetical protein MMC16_002212 [Acarospora aff. strigata]|nr:hypothetical protein [Acarospora aff. strigata]
MDETNLAHIMDDGGHTKYGYMKRHWHTEGVESQGPATMYGKRSESRHHAAMEPNIIAALGAAYDLALRARDNKDEQLWQL